MSVLSIGRAANDTSDYFLIQAQNNLFIVKVMLMMMAMVVFMKKIAIMTIMMMMMTKMAMIKKLEGMQKADSSGIKLNAILLCWVVHVSNFVCKTVLQMSKMYVKIA